MKKLLMIVIIVMFLSGCGKIENFNSEDSRIATNNSGNSIYSAFTTDGEWIYYIDTGVRKVKLSDGTGDSLVTDKVTPEKLSYIGNKLYFTSGGSFGYINLNKEASIEYLNLGIDYINDFQTDGKYYYVSGEKDMFAHDNGVYRNENWGYSPKLMPTTQGYAMMDLFYKYALEPHLFFAQAFRLMFTIIIALK